MGEKVIKLSRSYEAHGQVFDTVTLREPKLRDHFALGEPAGLQPGADDIPVMVERFDIIAAYAERLAVAGKPGMECLQDLDLADAFAVKEAIIGFFSEARRQRRAQTS